MRYSNIINELFERFPNLLKSEEHYPESLELPYYVFGYPMLVKEVVKLLKNGDNTSLLSEYFDFIEEMLNCEDRYVVELATVGFVEDLTNDDEIAELAQPFFGSQTQNAYENVKEFWSGAWHPFGKKEG